MALTLAWSMSSEVVDDAGAIVPQAARTDAADRTVSEVSFMILLLGATRP
jgi:hypothetical protein